jgi:hypothetical protein
MLHAFMMMSTRPKRTLLHFAIEIFENPRSHGESKIQTPMMPSIKFSVTSLFYERAGTASTVASGGDYALSAASIAAWNCA